MFLYVLVFGFFLSGGRCLDLETFYRYLQDNSTSTPECERQKSAFLQGLNDQDTWALKMLDAYGRIPEGITQGNNRDLGMFDQCLNIFEILDTTDIKGRYCYAGLVIPALDVNAIKPTVASREKDNLLLAACVPDGCLPSDFFGQFGQDDKCQTRYEASKLESADIAFLCFFIIVVSLMVASTAYDVYLQQNCKEPKHEVLLAFSVYTNGKKIIETRNDCGQIRFFNGMKVLSMFWVILGHRFLSLEHLAINLEETAAWKRKWYAVYALLAPLAVDTFLFVSGALSAVAFLKLANKPNHKLNVALFSLYRYLRLTPALAVLYFFQITLAKKVENGPLKPVVNEYIDQTCMSSNWWALFLYMQNFFGSEKMCMIHSWFVSVDMQCYMNAPLVLLPTFRYGRRIVYVLLPILTLIVITYNMFIFYLYDITLRSEDYFEMFFYVTHTRFPPWLIGAIFGTFLLDYQENTERYQIKNKLIVLGIWGAVSSVVAFLFFYQDDAAFNHTRLKSTFFFPLQKPLWALCLSWISYACLSGNAGIINSFLSLPIFQILSKITYSTYLVHSTLLLISIGSSRISPYFNDSDGIRTAIGDICLSYLVGAIWTLAFESPMLALGKIIFRRWSEGKQMEQV